MGFGDMLEEVRADASIAEIVKEKYRREEKREPPSLKDFYYRASHFASVCPRQEVLQYIHKIGKTDVTEPDSQVNFDWGTGIHYALQNLILPGAGVLLGAWKCKVCACIYGEDEKKPVAEKAIPRPDECGCGNKDPKKWEYVEYTLLDEELGTGGHTDGVLLLRGKDGLGILEAKSISPNGARKVRDCPQIEHVIQIQIYLMISGLKWGIILYIDKGVFGIDKGWIEHYVERDEEVIAKIKEELQTIRTGMKYEVPPEARVCAHRGCEKAQNCPVLTQCFGDPEPDGAAGRF